MSIIPDLGKADPELLRTLLHDYNGQINKDNLDRELRAQILGLGIGDPVSPGGDWYLHSGGMGTTPDWLLVDSLRNKIITSAGSPLTFDPGTGALSLTIARGGLITAITGFNVPAVLAIGANGLVLKSDGSDPSWGQVGSLGIANDAVGSAQIAADAVGSSEIAADAVGSSEIAANAVGTSEIADDAVTEAKLAPGVLPPGMVVPYVGASAPTGWLECDGASYLRATYPDLFTALGGTGSPYGLPDGTHFNVPDLRGRVPVGPDDMGSGDAGRLSANQTLGASSGEEKHQLTTAELASHNHGGTSGGMSANNPHSHGPPAGGASAFAVNFDYGTGTWTNTGSGLGFNGSTGSTDISHTHSIPSAGSDTSHNTMQPYQVLGYIIKI